MNTFPANSTIGLVHRAWAEGSCRRPDEQAFWLPVQRPIAVQCIEKPAPAPPLKLRPSWFLLAEEDRMINPKTQRFMANRMGACVRSEGADHSPMLTASSLVIDLILEAARESLSL